MQPDIRQPILGPEGPTGVARIGIRERLKYMTWSWFSITMSTGALGVLLALTPNRFPGLTTIGKIAFIIDLILFVCLTAMIAARFILVPSSFYYSLHNPTESLFFGAFWVSVALILQNIELYGQPYAGPWLTKALEICFWVYAAIVFVVGVFQYHTLFNEEKLSVANMMPVWILPIYPFVVAGPTAGILLGSQPPSEGFPMLVGGVMFQGLGWIVAHFMYTIYIARLMTSELPEPYMRPGMYISVGPVSYTAIALIVLGNRAKDIVPVGFFPGTPLPVGDVLKIIGSVMGIFLWLVGFWFFTLSSVAIVSGLKHFTFDLTWWAFIFPNSGLTVAAIQISHVLGSQAIMNVTSAMTLLVVIAWLVVAFATVKAIWQKRLLWPPTIKEHRED